MLPRTERFVNSRQPKVTSLGSLILPKCLFGVLLQAMAKLLDLGQTSLALFSGVSFRVLPHAS